MMKKVKGYILTVAECPHCKESNEFEGVNGGEHECQH